MGFTTVNLVIYFNLKHHEIYSAVIRSVRVNILTKSAFLSYIFHDSILRLFVLDLFFLNVLIIKSGEELWFAEYY